MITERTDVAAEIAATRAIADLLPATKVDGLGTGYCKGCDKTVPINTIEWDYDLASLLAEAVAAGFVVVYETRDNVRRAVLYGDWEVNPAARRVTA
jgi:hypothetical protein